MVTLKTLKTMYLIHKSSYRYQVTVSQIVIIFCKRGKGGIVFINESLHNVKMIRIQKYINIFILFKFKANGPWANGD